MDPKLPVTLSQRCSGFAILEPNCCNRSVVGSSLYLPGVRKGLFVARRGEEEVNFLQMQSLKPLVLSALIVLPALVVSLKGSQKICKERVLRVKKIPKIPFLHP